MMNGEFSNATNSKGIIFLVQTDDTKKYAVLSEYHSIYLLIFLVSQRQLFGQK